jgi:hypothetical protein
MRQVLSVLGVAPYGGNYDVLKKAIGHLQIDVSHFSGQAWNRGMKLGPRTSLENQLRLDSGAQSFKLKQKLLNANLFPKRCSHCRRKTWRGVPIPLELDHIDGKKSNNSLSNLRLLCPNCHALTPTYRGRNRSSPGLSSGLPPP